MGYAAVGTLRGLWLGVGEPTTLARLSRLQHRRILRYRISPYRAAIVVLMVHCSACQGWGRSTGGGSTVRLPDASTTREPS